MIGDRLKRERVRLGLTQPQFGEAVGVKKSTINDWQNGLSSPTARQLVAMILIGADVGYILTGKPTPADVLYNMRLAAQVTESGDMTPAQRDSLREKYGEWQSSPNATEPRVAEPIHSYATAHELRRDQRDLLDAYERCAPGARKAAIELLASAAQSQLDMPAQTQQKRSRKAR